MPQFILWYIQVQLLSTLRVWDALPPKLPLNSPSCSSSREPSEPTKPRSCFYLHSKLCTVNTEHITQMLSLLEAPHLVPSSRCWKGVDEHWCTGRIKIFCVILRDMYITCSRIFGWELEVSLLYRGNAGANKSSNISLKTQLTRFYLSWYWQFGVRKHFKSLGSCKNVPEKSTRIITVVFIFRHYSPMQFRVLYNYDKSAQDNLCKRQR